MNANKDGVIHLARKPLLAPLVQSGWIGPIGPPRKIGENCNLFCIFSLHGKISLKCHAKRVRRFLSYYLVTNQDLANILHRTDFHPSERGGPSGKLFRFVSCVRARGAYVRSDLGEILRLVPFPFPFWPWEVFPFPSALQGPIQLQLALSVYHTIA